MVSRGTTSPSSLSLTLLLVAATGCGGAPGAGGDVDGGGEPDAHPYDSDAFPAHGDAGTSGDGSPGGDGGSVATDAGSGADGAEAGDAGSGTGDAATGGDAGGSVGTPCQSGTGRGLWRLSFPDNAAGFATVESWDNGCDYSLADQACSLSGEPHDEAVFGPGVVFNSSTDFFRVRFSVAGESFTEATLYLSAHADGSGIPHAVLESPLYGSLSFAPTVPISTHRTYAVNWSDFLSPGDSPSLTAVTLRSIPTGLAVSFMELCVE